MSAFIDETCQVAGDLSSYQYYFVKYNSAADDGSAVIAVCAAVTDKPYGVLQDKPNASGLKCRVRRFGETLVSSDEALTINDAIGSSSDGQAQVVTIGSETTVYHAGTVTRSSTAAAGYARALINCINPPRAA